MIKRITLGIGILIILLALAGIGSAIYEYDASCSKCHTGFPTPLKANGTFFNNTHKFDGVLRPASGDSCNICHINVHGSSPNYSMTSTGSYYNVTHRYNSTNLSSEFFSSPGCGNCHADAVGGNFTIISGTPTYLTSSVCEACHKAKYDNWTNTMHRVMLTKNTSGAIMNLTVPGGLNWSTTNVSYMVVGKTSFRYLNETGYFFNRYYVESQTFASYGPSKYSCGSCHTTGYNASGGNQSGLPGIIGTWSEEGIACENCHGAGGNGHNVTVYSKGEDCIRCHYGNSRQGQAMTNRHATGPAEESMSSSCTFCHSPYDNYKLGAAASFATAKNVTCLVCHNPHDTTNEKYEGLLSPNGFNADNYSVVEEVKLSFFNGTASNASKQAGSNASLTAGNDVYDNLSAITSLYPGTITSRKDSNYGTAPINVTGRPVSEVLCSLCHYRHGLGHIASVNQTHGRNNADSNQWATCVDCHMSASGSLADHSFDAENATNYPTNTCSKGTNCHVTSTQNRSLSNITLVPVISEWEGTAHNDKDVSVPNSTGVRNPNSSFYRSINGTTGVVTIKSRANSCLKCHSPMDWNPATAESVTTQVQLTSDFKGIVCAVCHNIHDMGDSITNSVGKKYSWYNRDAIPVYNTAGTSITRYKANYTLMANTTELCGNCHSNIRYGRTGPGYSTTTSVTPLAPHGFPAKDVFAGSWKQSSSLNFECIDCHMYINKTNATGAILNDSEKTMGHSFAVNETGLQNESSCNGCHDGTWFDNITTVIEDIQNNTQNKWNTTNTTVMNALSYINASSGEKNLSRNMIAQAYWKLLMVSSDESWGVHNPTGTDDLLDEAVALANSANESLGRGNTTAQLYAGWNLVSLNETPANTTPIAVMSSVSSNLTVVWGLNASTQTWLLYDPAGPVGLNTLTRMVKGEIFEIKVAGNCTWVV
ncbi:MAG: ammonia-forming cytochrome c nitrite reductase subunit c552 [Candidatus Methanoperedens sp.]|nr:ammonia-forming cytochrome c nitrite reductase subunit c552 [Candidatus Methanoperedens sp.]